MVFNEKQAAKILRQEVAKEKAQAMRRAVILKQEKAELMKRKKFFSKLSPSQKALVMSRLKLNEKRSLENKAKFKKFVTTVRSNIRSGAKASVPAVGKFLTELGRSDFLKGTVFALPRAKRKVKKKTTKKRKKR